MNIQVDNNLTKINKDTYSSIIDINENVIEYVLHISRHSQTKRTLSITKGEEDRLIEHLNIKRVNHIIRPHLKKMIDNPGKFLISLEKKFNSSRVYLLLVIEPDKFNKDKWFISLITTLDGGSTLMTFKRVPVNNRLQSKLYYNDLLEIKGLMSDDELIRATADKVYNPNAKKRSKLKIIKKNNL